MKLITTILLAAAGITGAYAFNAAPAAAMAPMGNGCCSTQCTCDACGCASGSCGDCCGSCCK